MSRLKVGHAGKAAPAPQRAFIDEQALRCKLLHQWHDYAGGGNFLKRIPKLTEDQVRSAAQSCRCGTRQESTRAVMRAAQEGSRGLSAPCRASCAAQASGALIITFARAAFGRAAQTRPSSPSGWTRLTAISPSIRMDWYLLPGKVDLGTGMRTALAHRVAEAGTVHQYRMIKATWN
jgi:hypothetical protein